MGFSESAVIKLLAEIFASSDERVLLGIGDDAALVRGFDQQILTTDIAVEGIHFKCAWSSPYEIGARIAKANIADILSMNGRCDYLLVAASLTGEENLEWIGELARGIADSAKAAGAIVVGGDLSKSPTLQIAITAVGHSSAPITRSGARLGDSIYLSSLTGWSAAGLHILQHSLTPSLASASTALTEYRNPTLDSAIDFSSANSMADISDSLLVQGAQIAEASQVGLEIDIEAIAASAEFSELNQLAQELSVDIWQWVLAGGEDHVLLATGQGLPGICIGRVVEMLGISYQDPRGKMKVAPVSWSHFA